MLGIRKAETLIPKLKERIKICFGLFCNHFSSYIATELLKKIRIKLSEIKEILYRDQGWPSKMRIEMKNSKILLLSNYWITYPAGYFFANRRCILCQDLTAELSDIPSGDAWLSEYSKDKKETSIVISRTEFGEIIIKEASRNKRIKINKVSKEKAIRS